MENEGATPETTEQSTEQAEPEGPSFAEQLAALQRAHEDFVRKTNKELKRYRLQSQGVQPKEDEPARAQSSEPQISWADQRKLARLEAQLPESMRSTLEEQSEGMSFVETVKLYETIIKLQSASEKQASKAKEPAPSVPNGRSRAPQTQAAPAVPHPKSLTQFMKMSKEQRAVLMDDPNFDPTSLPTAIDERFVR